MIDGPKPYSAMKDSGLEWLGNVPAHWSVLPLKRIAQFNGGSGFPVSAQGDTDEEILFAKVSDMNRPGNEREIASSANTVSLEVARSLGAQVFERDTIIFPKVGGALLTNKRRLLVRETCIDNNLMGCVVRGANAAFTFRMLRWLDLARMAKPGPVPALSEGDVREIRVTIPHLPEQTAIVRFLDHADRRIRRYIRSKQKLIELLEEQKQVIVHQAVTGQIDVRTGRPYPAYRPSAVNWLEKVPEHWRMVRNGRIFVQRNETGFPELPILEVSLKTGVRIRDLESSGRKQMMTIRAEYKRAVKGDIAYNMMRMWQGAVGIAPVDGLVSPAYVVAEPLAGTEPRYFTSLFRTRAYMAEVDRYSHGIVKDRNRLYWEDFKQMRTPYPPPSEQVTIADAMDHLTATTEDTIRRIERQSVLLREYRTRLIADVVTGKVDVREAAAALPEVDPLADEDDRDDTVEAIEQAASYHEEVVVAALEN